MLLFLSVRLSVCGLVLAWCCLNKSLFGFVFYSKMKAAQAGESKTLYSPGFITSKHGYRLSASVCLNGDGKGKGSHLSVFICILKGRSKSNYRHFYTSHGIYMDLSWSVDTAIFTKVVLLFICFFMVNVRLFTNNEKTRLIIWASGQWYLFNLLQPSLNWTEKSCGIKKRLLSFILGWKCPCNLDLRKYLSYFCYQVHTMHC